MLIPNLLLLCTLLVYLPILLNPHLLLNKGNDLEEFFWPIFFFLKQQVLDNHQLPLWNNLFLSGTPLLPDPQSPLFYLPNIIFLLIPLDLGFIVSFFIHSFWGGLGTYYLAKNFFKFSTLTCFFVAALYILNPFAIAHLEAGHFGLFLSLAWIPWVALSLFKLSQRPSISTLTLLAVSLAAIYLTHILIFAVTFFSSIFLFIFTTWKRFTFKKIVFLVAGYLLTVALVAIVLLPQLRWQPHTTRDLLIELPDTFPKWETKGEFIQALVWPWLKIPTLDSEKWITVGLSLTLLASWGFLFLKRRWQIIIVLISILFVIVLLNNLSPIYQILTEQQIFLQFRVSTRLWIIPFLIIIFLAGFALEKISKWKLLVVILVAAELLSLGWIQLLKPVSSKDTVPAEIYQFIGQDKDMFRVFCVTRCIPQKQAAINNLQLVEGYSTLIQKNYFEYFIQLDQVYWNRYSLTLPPMEIYNFRQIQPHAPTLAEYNVKYIISPYPLSDKNLRLEKKYHDFFIYINTLVKPRAYFVNTGNKNPQAKVLKYTPNHIRVDTSNHSSVELILAEVYSPGWKAYLNGKEEVKIKEHLNKLRGVEIKADTNFIDFKYEPDSFFGGKIITAATLIIISVVLLVPIFKRKNTFYHRR